MNKIGHNIQITIFGESHGPYIGLTIDGLKPGIVIDQDRINQALIKRQGPLDLATSRQEPNHYQFISGVFNGFTTGAPVTVLVNNQEQRSKDYHPNLVRPSHADYLSYYKSQGYHDYRGGGHFSGRLTVVIVILGAILRPLLSQQGIEVGTRIKEFNQMTDPIDHDDIISIDTLHNFQASLIPTFDLNFKDQIINQIKYLKTINDSRGVILQTIALGLPIGLGEPFFLSVESYLSSLVFSIPGIKGICFGSGQDFAKLLGSQLNDSPYYQSDTIKYHSNHNGGICGGLTTGQPLIFDTIVRPTPTIGQVQKTIDLNTKANLNHQFEGRHDTCFGIRVPIILESLTIFAIADLLGARLWIK